jgi:hypothetical protein
MVEFGGGQGRVPRWDRDLGVTIEIFSGTAGERRRPDET